MWRIIHDTNGVPLWLIVGGLAAVFYNRHQVKKTPDIFPARLRTVSGSVHGIGEKWSRMPVYALWIHDVLLIHSGLPLAHITPMPVSLMKGESVKGDPSKLKRLEASSALNIAPDEDGARVALAGEPFVAIFQVTTATNGGDSAQPIEGAVVHYTLESTVADDGPTGVVGRTVSDADGRATVAFLAPSIGGAYQLKVQLGVVETSIPVSIVTEPNWILMTPETTTTVVGGETVKLEVKVIDSDGRPVVDELTLRLETDLGHWDDGEQVRTVVIADGIYEATFFPGEIAGVAAIRARASYLSTTVSIDIRPDAASHIEASVGASSALIAAGGESIDLTFFVHDRFANPVADDTSVRLFTSGGELSASDLMTQDGQVTTTLHVPTGAISPIQVWAVVPGTHAQTELTIVIMSNQLWLPVVAGGPAVD